MKTRRKFFTLLALSAICIASAQQKDSIRFGAMQQLSISFGEKGTTLGLNIVNGVRFHRFFTGIGADYRWQDFYGPAPNMTSAVFFDGRYYINKKKNLFAKMNAGVNFIVDYHNSTSNFYKYERSPGYYGGVGLGFKARLSKELFYSFDISYVNRQSRFTYSYNDWRFPNEWAADKYDLRQPMIMVNMGLEIF